LRTRLAEHMVPAELAAMAALPSQPSGKVDRRALQRSVPTRRARATDARTPTEATLLTAFRAVLARQDFGVTDDFFAFGGYSLLATRLVLALRTALATPLAVRALFDHPTVADLAEYLDGARSEPARLTDLVLLPLRASGSGPPLFCVHPVSGLALAYSGLLRGLPDRPVYGLQAHSLATDTELPADLDAMAARYVSEIRAVQPVGPYHLLGWSLGGTVAHLMACQLAAEGERVDALALLDAVPARFLGQPDRHWSVERGLAQLLKVSGYPVGAEEVDPAVAVRLVGEGDGGLSGFTGDDLCNVVLSWRHSSGLRSAAAPVHSGELLLFEATRGRRKGGLGQLWQPQVGGPIRVHPVPADHWEMAQPGVLDQVAAVLRALVGA
jgi:thioesterase domain-containing protein